MWRVVCVGPGPMDQVRRVLDRGPLLPDRARANSIASFLRSTGLYESVEVEGSKVKVAAAAVPGGPALSSAMDGAGGLPGEKSIDDLASMLDA